MAKRVEAAASAAELAAQRERETVQQLFDARSAVVVVEKTYQDANLKAMRDRLQIERALAGMLGDGAHVLAGHVLEITDGSVRSCKRVERVL